MEANFEGKKPNKDNSEIVPDDEFETTPLDHDQLLNQSLYEDLDLALEPELDELDLNITSEHDDLELTLALEDEVILMDQAYADEEKFDLEEAPSPTLLLSRAALHTVATGVFSFATINAIMGAHSGALLLLNGAMAVLAGTVATLSWRQYLNNKKNDSIEYKY